MEASLVEVLNCEENSPAQYSYSNHLHKEPKSAGRYAAVDGQETYTCNHFTIRGYVASMREKDANLSWPFNKLDNIPEEEEKLLPPMHVIHFKRWNCRDCSKRTNASINVDQNGNDNVEKKYTGASCHGNDALQEQFLSSEQVYEDHIRRRSAEADSSNNSKVRLCVPSICCNKFSKSPPTDLTKGAGSEVPQRWDANTDHDKNKSSESHHFDKRWPSFLEERAEGNTGKDFAGIRSLAFEIARVKPKLNNLINGFSGSTETHALPMSMKKNGTMSGCEDNEDIFKLSKEEQRVGVLEEFPVPIKLTPKIHPKTDSAADNHDQDRMHLVKNNKTTPTGGPSPHGNESESGENSEEVSFMDSRLRHKKVRKVRLLSDIIRNGELHRSQVVQVSDGDTKGRNSELPGTAKFVDRKCLRKHKLILNKRDSDNESSDNKDEGPSLMHWLKKISRRNISLEEAKAKLIKTYNSDVSKGTPSASLEKVAAVNVEGTLIRGMDKVDSNPCKQHPLSKEDGIPTKLITTSEVIALKQLHPRRPKRGRSAESPHLGLKIKRNLKKANLDRKNRVSVIEGHKRMCFSKVSSNKKACSGVKYFSDDKIARMKEKDIPTSKQDNLDDFPMDIVELLARNQHERHQTNAEAAVEYVDRVSQKTGYMMNNNHGKVSQMAGSMNNDNPGAFSEFIRHSSLFQLSNEGSIPSSSCRIWNNESDNNQIDLNRETAPCHSHVGFCNFQLNGPRNYICDSNRKALKPNHFKETSGQRTCNIYNGLHCPDIPNTLESNYGFHYGNEATRMACITNNMAFLSETDSRQPSDSSRVKMLDIMDGSSNFHTNEAISSKQLLGLMDPRSCSEQFLHSSISRSHVFNSHDQLNLPRFSAGVKSNEPQIQKYQYLAIGSPNPDHHPENSHKPLRPLPRFGVLGSLLQKEITAQSKDSEAPFGFRRRYLNNLLTPELGSRNEAEESPSAFVSRHQNSKPVSQVGSRDNCGQLQYVNSSCKMEVCSVNRNPADFVIPDEDCEFMIGSDDLRCRYTSLSGTNCPPKDLSGPRRCHKLKKLTKIKEFLRS